MIGRQPSVRRVVKARRDWVTIAFVVLVVVPVYVSVATLVIRSGLWRVNGSFSNDQFKALLVFLGTAVGTTATLIGVFVTRASAARSLAQQQLDTAVQVLNLVKHENGYAAKAVVSGALATLVHLGHPVIAMRTLQTALGDDAVDINAAVWLIDQVLGAAPQHAVTGDVTASRQEAVGLLQTNLPRLHDDSHPGEVFWPVAVFAAWPRGLGQQTGWLLLRTLLLLLLGRPASWWNDSGNTWSWVIFTLDRLVQDTSSDLMLRIEAATYGLKLLEAHNGDVNGLTTTVRRDDVVHRFKEELGPPDARIELTLRLDEAIAQWVQQAQQDPQLGRPPADVPHP